MMQENTSQTQQLITDEVMEIINYRPHWIIRKGNLLFLAIIILFVALSWFVKYPDVVKAKVLLLPNNPPKPVSANAGGRLELFLAADEQQVKKDQPIAYINNTGSYTDVLKLQQWINRAITAMQKDSSFSFILTDPLPGLINLGELQPVYQQFATVMEQNRRFANGDYYNKKRSMLDKDMQMIVAQKGNNLRQKNMSEEDRAMIEKEFNAYKKLADDKVIAPLELHQYKSKLLAREQTLEQLQTQVIGSDISLASKQQEILELEKMMKEQRQQLQSSLFELKSQMELWFRQYVITAPEEGKLFFVKGLNENNNISAGQLLFYLEPIQAGFYAELQGAQYGFGKVKEGQRVIVKVESYPSHEFGYITGTIGRTTGMPVQGDSVTVRLLLPQGLTTNYGDTIPYRKNLQASAEIITDDKRLISRLFSQLKK